ncbi:MAG: hypothetical protein R6V86_03225 [Spirochaetia bacterium]
MKNTSILIALSVFTLALGAVLNLSTIAFVPGSIGVALGVTLLKAGKRGSGETCLK